MQIGVDFNTSAFISKLKMTEKNAQKAAQKAVEDCTLELERIASEITPIDKGTLSRSSSRRVKVTGQGIIGEVEFAVREGSMNYALWIHEGVYQLGEHSKARGGTTGWSGKYYAVGRKYLERPLKGEQAKFYEYIGNQIKGSIGGV